jgi:hypothetical protein
MFPTTSSTGTSYGSVLLELAVDLERRVGHILFGISDKKVVKGIAEATAVDFERKFRSHRIYPVEFHSCVFIIHDTSKTQKKILELQVIHNSFDAWRCPLNGLFYHRMEHSTRAIAPAQIPDFFVHLRHQERLHTMKERMQRILPNQEYQMACEHLMDSTSKINRILYLALDLTDDANLKQEVEIILSIIKE